MIRAEFNWNPGKSYTIRLQGHACSAPEGSDLVCAAASMLMYTLARRMQNLQKHRIIRDLSIRIEAGDAQISAKACKGYITELESTVFTILQGLELLAQQYPENVAIVCDLRNE